MCGVGTGDSLVRQFAKLRDWTTRKRKVDVKILHVLTLLAMGAARLELQACNQSGGGVQGSESEKVLTIPYPSRIEVLP